MNYNENFYAEIFQIYDSRINGNGKFVFLFLLADAYLIIMQVSCTRLCVLTACLLYLFGLHKSNDGLHHVHSLLCQPSQPSLQPIPSHLCLSNLPYLVTWCLLNLLYTYLVFQAVWSSTLIQFSLVCLLSQLYLYLQPYLPSQCSMHACPCSCLCCLVFYYCLVCIAYVVSYVMPYLVCMSTILSKSSFSLPSLHCMSVQSVVLTQKRNDTI